MGDIPENPGNEELGDPDLITEEHVLQIMRDQPQVLHPHG